MLIKIQGSVALSSCTGRVSVQNGHSFTGFKLTVDVDSSTSIANIKYLVNRKAGIPVTCLVIRYLGKVLENDLCLAECHIVDGSSLEVCVLPFLKEIPFSHKHPVTESSTKDLESVFGSEGTEYDVLSRLDRKEATSGCEANGPSKSVREEKKTVGCKEQARGSDEWVARTRRGSVGCKINRPRKVRGSDDRVAPLRRGSICYEMNGPRKAVRKLGKAAGCGGSDGLVAPREIGPCSEQGRGSICYEVNGPRKAVRKLGKAAGCGGSDGLVAPREIGSCSEHAAVGSNTSQELNREGACEIQLATRSREKMVGLHGAMNARASKLPGSGEVEGFGRQAESWSPTRFGRKHVPRLGSNRTEELKKWSIWEKANKDVDKALVRIPELTSEAKGLHSFRLLTNSEEAHSFVAKHSSYIVIHKAKQVLFDIHNVLSSSVSGIDIAFTCNDEAATVLLRGNNCSYAVVTPQRVVEYDKETLKKEELKEFIRKILRDRSRNYSKPAT